MSRKESKLKLFIENMAFYGVLSMLSKAVPFITLPIITRLLPNSSAYGMSDILNVINSFGTAIAIMGLYDAIFREYFERKDDVEYQKKVVSTGLNLVLISSSIIVILMYSFSEKISIFLLKSKEYVDLIKVSGITIFFMAITSVLGAPTRMRNMRKVYMFTGISFPLVGFLLTIFFIKKGYTYEALIYSTLGMSIISAIVFLFLNRKDFNLKILDKKIAKELYKIGLPLLPTFLIYWVFNSMDRVMINEILGSKELGIYSIGAKVASISQLIYTAFAGGWQYFSFSTMKDQDQVDVNSKIFEYLGIISFLVYIISQPFIKIVFNFFLEGDYVRGSEVFSFLFLSPLILMLFQVLVNQLLIIKKSWTCTFSLIIGLILNLYLNYNLIPIFGIRAAALATLFSYIISVVIVSLTCIKKNLLVIKKRFIIIFMLLTVGIICEFFLMKFTSYFYIMIFITIIIFYFEELKKLNKLL